MDKRRLNTLLIKTLDNAIEESIQKFRIAKTGAEVRIFISEYEELMLLRCQILAQKDIWQAVCYNTLNMDRCESKDNGQLAKTTLLVSVIALIMSILWVLL